MKTLFLYIVLVSQTILICKPALPYVSDLISHVLFLKHHMATVHFENGKYHVHKDVLKNVKEENNSNTNRSSKKDNAAVEYFLPLNKYLSSEIKQGSAFYSTIPIPSVIEGIYTYNYPPPRI